MVALMLFGSLSIGVAQDAATDLHEELDRPARDSNDGRHIVDAVIDSVAPLRLQADEHVAVDLQLKLSMSVPLEVLQDQLIVYLDGARLAPASPSTGPESEQARERLAEFQARRRVGLVPREDIVTTRMTLFARAPTRLPSEQEMLLTVFSQLDGHNIASFKVTTAPSTWIKRDVFWVGLLAGAVAIFVLLLAGHQSTRILGQQKALREERAKLQEIKEIAAAQTDPAFASSVSDAYVRPELPQGLTSALRRGQVAIVMGPQVAAQAGRLTDATLWTAVLHRLKERFDEATALKLQSLIQGNGHEAVIEPLVSLVGRKSLLEALARELSADVTATDSIHQYIASFANAGVRVFVDLTWDGELQKALRFASPAVYTDRHHEGLSEALRNAQLVVLKPIGQISDPESVALTQQEFRRRLAHAPRYERCLASLFSAQTILFIGLDTKHIEQFIGSLPADIEGAGREHYALIAADWRLELWETGFGRRYGITAIPLPRERPDVLGSLLEELVRDASHDVSGAAMLREGRSLGIDELRSLSLRNIGTFKSLDLAFDERWNLLLGDNGGGKSTILRAITLALAGNDGRAEAMAGRLLRFGEQTGSIELTFGASEEIKVRVTLVRDGPRIQIKSPQVTLLQAGQTLVLAFPALRGVTTGQVSGPMRLEESDPSVDDIAPLLQDKVDTRNTQLRQWLINTAIQAKDAPGSRQAKMFDTFQAVLRDLVPGRNVAFSHVDQETWTIWLKCDDGDVSFESLSQGTSSILGWVGVLLQRLYHVHRALETPEHGAGLVLIDEIDAHLHPRWQRKLVSLTREKFPNIQVIASSHSPLLAGAMQRAELRIVERDASTGEMSVRTPREDLHGQRADDILTSSLFALDTTRSPEAEAKIQEYFSLFENPYRTEEQEAQLKLLEVEVEQLNYGSWVGLRQVQENVESVLLNQIEAIDPEQAQLLSERFSHPKADPHPEKKKADKKEFRL
jgi:predicted ATPase